jgi:superfamily II DNA or RNA helicase
VTLAAGETYELPFPLQKEAGEDMDGWLLKDGGGKTVLFSHITRETAARGNRVCVLVHRAELLRQASASLTALGVPHGLIAAGRSMNLAAPVQVASVQSLARRLHLIPQ